MRRPAASLVLLVVLTSAGGAAAHPLVEEGRRRFESADFQGALTALEAAEDASDLAFEDVLELFELRALVYLALNDEQGLSRSLDALASLDPDHEFGPEVPPEVTARFADLNADVLRLDVEVRREGHEAVLEARVAQGSPGLVRSVVVTARVDGGTWERSERGLLRVEARRGARVEWYVRVSGPGGAPILTRGSAAEPERVVPGGQDPEPFHSSPDRSVRRRTSPWVWVGVGAGAAVLVAVVVAVAVSAGGEPDTVITGPDVDF